MSEKTPITVILVHGAFADGSSWNKVVPLLQAKGLKVVAVQNPLTSFEDDVAATKRAYSARVRVCIVGCDGEAFVPRLRQVKGPVRS